MGVNQSQTHRVWKSIFHLTPVPKTVLATDHFERQIQLYSGSICENYKVSKTGDIIFQHVTEYDIKNCNRLKHSKSLIEERGSQQISHVIRYICIALRYKPKTKFPFHFRYIPLLFFISNRIIMYHPPSETSQYQMFPSPFPPP